MALSTERTVLVQRQPADGAVHQPVGSPSLGDARKSDPGAISSDRRQ